MLWGRDQIVFTGFSYDSLFIDVFCLTIFH
jgi:hypothetical protein